MKNKFLYMMAALLVCGAVCTSCSDDEETTQGQQPEPGKEEGSEVSSLIIVASADNAAYLLKSDTFDEGSLTAKGAGKELEASSATTWVFYKDKYLYRLNYNMGQAGTTKAFYLDSNGTIQQRPKAYTISNFTTYGTFGDYIVTAAAGSGETENNKKFTEDGTEYIPYVINFTLIDTKAEVNSSKVIDSENFLGTGEYVTFSGLLEANGKLYTAVIPLGCSPYGIKVNPSCVLEGNEGLVSTSSSGQGGGMTSAGTLSGTQYADRCYVAVFDDDTFTNPTIIETDQLSYATGRMRSAYYQTIWAADNGDVYVFSPSFARQSYGADDPRTTHHNSGVMRIKAGATEFDSAYGMVDIESLTDGHQIYRCWHITEDYFLLQMYTDGYTIMGTGTNELVIYKGEDKTVKKVTGLPDDLSSISTKNPYCENGVAYIAVATESGQTPYICKIDPKTATATEGTAVSADEISALGKFVAE